MTDELIERGTMKVTEAMEEMGITHNGMEAKRIFEFALAALKPGDDLPNGLHVETSQFWRGVSDENNMLVARRASEEMRERAAALIEDERLWEQIPGQAWSGAIKEAANYIRALPLEEQES